MGVRGLTTYINQNQDAFLKPHLLHDSNLIIDGHSLCAQLYRLLNSFSAFGGDYDKFASYTKSFFKNLRKCNITSYVIFDGSYENRKIRTAYSRLRSKIYGASRLDAVTQSSLQIFPLLLREVFKEVLIEIKVAYTVCEFEADDEIAAMARHLNCPVLSYDSDFFIYNVLYIPFNTLHPKAKPYEDDDKKLFVLECKMYKSDYLFANFGDLNKDMLPLLATLLGNDYVEKKVFNKFFSQLKLPKSKRLKNEQQRCIHGLFKWLENETLDSAIAKILGRLKKKHKNKVFAMIKKSVDAYDNHECRSLKYFSISVDVKSPRRELQMPEESDTIDAENTDEDSDNNEESAKEEGDAESDDDGDDDDISQILGIPEWFVEGTRQNWIPHNYLNLYTHHLHFCSPQAEDYNDEDAFLSTLPILRYAFDMLTDFSHEHCVYVSRENDTSYKRILVDSTGAVPRLLEVPIQELAKEQLNQYFITFLNEKLPDLDLNSIYLLPANFQLFFISMLWWIKYCEVTSSHVHSLLICYIMLGVIDEKTGTFRGHHFFNNKFASKVEELKKNSVVATETDELFLNKNKVLYEDCLIAASVLLKHFEIDDSIRKKPKSYDTKKMHLFAKFQCCLLQFNSLNTLCACPFETTKYSKCLNGTFMYNIALKLENQIDPIMFMNQYLKGAVSVLQFYRSICKVYETFVEPMGLTTSKWMGKKKRRKKKNLEDEEIAFIIKGFESEVVI